MDWRLYENCIRYRGLPNTKWFEMDLFKKLMGVPPGKYDIFRDFKRRVLDKAVDEVNTYSDLFIEAEFVREGRKVKRVRFKLKERAKKTRLGGGRVKAKLETSGDELKTKLYGAFDLSEEQVEQLLTEYDGKFVQEKIAVIEASKPYKEGKVQNLAGYLLSAVKKNYQMPKVKQYQVINIQDAKQELEVGELKRQVEAIRKGFISYKEKLIKEALDALSESEREKFMAAFAISAESTKATILKLQRKRYSEENVMKSPQIKALLRQFAMRELDMSAAATFEEYVLQLEEPKREAWQKLKSYDPDHPLLRFSE